MLYLSEESLMISAQRWEEQVNKQTHVENGQKFHKGVPAAILPIEPFRRGAQHCPSVEDRRDLYRDK